MSSCRRPWGRGELTEPLKDERGSAQEVARLVAVHIPLIAAAVPQAMRRPLCSLLKQVLHGKQRFHAICLEPKTASHTEVFSVYEAASSDDASEIDQGGLEAHFSFMQTALLAQCGCLACCTFLDASVQHVLLINLRSHG